MRKIMIGLLLVALGSLPVANAGKPPGAGGGGTGGGGTGTEGIVGQNLGVLVGDKYSDAWDVNAVGHVVGRSYNSGSRKAPQVIKAFYWNGTTMSRLLPATNGYDAEASAISNTSGSSETAAGYEYKDACGGSSEPCTREQYPVIWRGDLSSDTTGVRLACGGGGVAFGINDSGKLAVGFCGDVYAGSDPVIGVIWDLTNPPGTAKPIVANGSAFPAADLEPSFPDGHNLDGHTIGLEGTAWGVNNDGIVVGTLTWVDETAAEDCYRNRPAPCAVDVSYSKAYLYDSVAKKGIILEPAVGDVQSSAYAVSNKVGSNKVYVAGATIPCSDRSQCDSRGIRWTVNLGLGGSAVFADLLAEQDWAEGVNENGFVAGTHNSEPSRRGNIIQTATLYSALVGYIPLKPPGGSDSASRGMAGQCSIATDTIHVVGVVNVSGTWTAAHWGIPCSRANPSQ